MDESSMGRELFDLSCVPFVHYLSHCISTQTWPQSTPPPQKKKKKKNKSAPSALDYGNGGGAPSGKKLLSVCSWGNTNEREADADLPSKPCLRSPICPCQSLNLRLPFLPPAACPTPQKLHFFVQRITNSNVQGGLGGVSGGGSVASPSQLSIRRLRDKFILHTHPRRPGWMRSAVWGGRASRAGALLAGVAGGNARRYVILVKRRIMHQGTAGRHLQTTNNGFWPVR